MHVPTLQPSRGQGRHRARVLMLGGCGPLRWRPTAPPHHWDQAPAAGSETGRRSVDGSPGVFSGSICSRKSPRPRESVSYLSGCSQPSTWVLRLCLPPGRVPREGRCIVACRLAGCLKVKLGCRKDAVVYHKM
jgi:hypothetical protein